DGDDHVVVVHCAAAPFEPTPLHVLDAEVIRRQHEVAVLGGVALFRGVARHMVRARSGLFVAVLSEAVEKPLDPRAPLPKLPRGFGHYAAAKEGLRAVARSVASEFGERGVRSICVSPPFMDTQLTKSWHPAIRAGMPAPVDPAIVARRIV